MIIDIYVNTDAVGWTSVNFWTWGGDGSHSPKNTAWPGDKVTSTVSAEGKNWYKNTYHINSATDEVNFVFSTGSGSPQTVDINDIRETTFFEISTETEGGKNLVNTIKTGITETTVHQATTADIYSIDGRLIRKGGNTEGLPKGIYIIGHRKMMVK